MIPDPDDQFATRRAGVAVGHQPKWVSALMGPFAGRGEILPFRVREGADPELLGRSMSHQQLSLLEASGARYLMVMLDGDEAGRSAVPAMMDLLSRSTLRVKFALLPDGTQPDTVAWPVLQQLLSLPD